MMDLNDLAELIVKHINRTPVSVDLWSAKEIADYLKVGPRQVSERYAALPDFPAAIRLPAESGRGHYRWKASEVIAWAESRQETKKLRKAG